MSIETHYIDTIVNSHGHHVNIERTTVDYDGVVGHRAGVPQTGTVETAEGFNAACEDCGDDAALSVTEAEAREAAGTHQCEVQPSTPTAWAGWVTPEEENAAWAEFESGAEHHDDVIR